MGEETLIDRLKWIKDEHLGGTQTALAEAMQCGDPYVSALFKGTRTNLGSEYLDNLLSSLKAKSVNIRREWLRSGSGERYDPAPAPLSEQTALYRVAPQLDLSLIFKTQSFDEMVKTLSGVLLDAGATAAARLQNAEVLFAEVRKRLQTEISSAEDDADAVASVALAKQAGRPGPGLPPKPQAAATSGRRSSTSDDASSESKEPLAAPTKAQA